MSWKNTVTFLVAALFIIGFNPAQADHSRVENDWSRSSGTFNTLSLENDILVSCFPLALEGLEKGLRKIEKGGEMLVYNNDKTHWYSKNGCTIGDSRHVFTKDRQTACNARVFRCSTVGFYGFIVTKDHIVEVYKGAYTGQIKGSPSTREPDLAWRPGEMYRRDEYVLPDLCMRRVKIINGVKIYGHQFSRSGHNYDRRAKRFCSRPMEKSDYVPQNKRNRREDGRNYRQDRQNRERKHPRTPEQLEVLRILGLPVK